jgi:hypothetical protein
MRGDAEDAAAKVFVKPVHYRQNNDQGHHPHPHSGNRNESDQGHERLSSLGQQVPYAYKKLKAHDLSYWFFFSGLM